jgi:hypothetical protein
VWRSKNHPVRAGEIQQRRCTEKHQRWLTAALIPGKAREAIEKLLNIVNFFGIGIDIPPSSSR